MPEYAELLKLAASFVVVVVIIYAVYYLLNRFNAAAYLNKKGKIQIEEMHFLSKGKGLCLVKIRDDKLLLALDEKGITVLKEWKDAAPETDV